MATVRTVLLTTDTAMVGGIMVTIMYTAVNLVVIKVAAVWIDGGWVCLVLDSKAKKQKELEWIDRIEEFDAFMND